LEKLRIYFINHAQKNLEINFEPFHHLANVAIDENFDILRRFNDKLMCMEKGADYCNTKIFLPNQGGGKPLNEIEKSINLLGRTPKRSGSMNPPPATYRAP
jgi:hypothetical protein